MTGQKSEYRQWRWWLTIRSGITIEQTRVGIDACLVSEDILGNFRLSWVLMVAGQKMHLGLQEFKEWEASGLQPPRQNKQSRRI